LEISENPLRAPLAESIPVPEALYPSIHPPMVLPDEPIPIPPPVLEHTTCQKDKKRAIDTKITLPLILWLISFYLSISVLPLTAWSMLVPYLYKPHIPQAVFSNLNLLGSSQLPSP
jgi:hypothetical protein